MNLTTYNGEYTHFTFLECILLILFSLSPFGCNSLLKGKVNGPFCLENWKSHWPHTSFHSDLYKCCHQSRQSKQTRERSQRSVLHLNWSYCTSWIEISVSLFVCLFAMSVQLTSTVPKKGSLSLYTMKFNRMFNTHSTEHHRFVCFFFQIHPLD